MERRVASHSFIPGLDHSRSRDGEWVESSHHLFQRYDARDPKRLSIRRKNQRAAQQDGRQATLW